MCRRHEDGGAWHCSVTRGAEPFRVFVAESRLLVLKAAFRWLLDREQAS